MKPEQLTEAQAAQETQLIVRGIVRNAAREHLAAGIERITIPSETVGMLIGAYALDMPDVGRRVLESSRFRFTVDTAEFANISVPMLGVRTREWAEIISNVAEILQSQSHRE